MVDIAIVQVGVYATFIREQWPVALENGLCVQISSLHSGHESGRQAKRG
jgi:hypothetical protein